MTIIITIKDGNRYTFWNVTSYEVRPDGATVNHSDRIPSVVQGYVEKAVRRG